MVKQFEFEEEKFKELVLYIAEKTLDDSSFGATHLNKALFFSDFLAYLNFGAPITGATYQRLPYGPAPRELVPMRHALVRNGDLRSMLNRYSYRAYQRRLIPLREADLSLFSPKEIAIVDNVIETLRYRSATEVSELSHRLCVGWQFAADKDEIPYYSVYLRPAPVPTQQLIERAQEFAEDDGLQPAADAAAG